MKGEMVTIQALKYPNIPHYEWKSEIVEKTPHYILSKSKPGRKLIHHTKNDVFTMKHTSLEYFSLKEWFTVSMEVDNGHIVSHYCNVAKPSIVHHNRIRFIDLDIDLIQKRNEAWKVVDVDEFETNSVYYEYPSSLKNGALIALEKLKSKISKSEFPFNKQITDWL